MNHNRALVNEKVGAQLKTALDKYPKTQLQIAEMLGISTKQLQNYSKGIFPRYKGENIKALDELLGTNLYERLYGGEPESETKVPPGTMEEAGQEPGLSDQSFNNLTESNKALAYANQKLADAHFIIAKNNDELLQMAKGATVRSDARNFEVLQARLTILSDFLARIGSGHRYPSYDQAIEALSSAWLGIEDHPTGQAGIFQEYSKQNISHK